jgi:hypothetical protein
MAIPRLEKNPRAYAARLACACGIVGGQTGIGHCCAWASAVETGCREVDAAASHCSHCLRSRSLLPYQRPDPQGEPGGVSLRIFERQHLPGASGGRGCA